MRSSKNTKLVNQAILHNFLRGIMGDLAKTNICTHS